MHPVLFTLPLPWGEQPIYAYGSILAVALVSAFSLIARLGRRDGLDEDRLGGAFLAATLGGLACARALYALLNRDELAEADQSLFDLGAGGLSAYGGLLGGALAAAVYLRLKRAPILPYADVAAPAAALGVALTRVGCYLHGCDFGARLSDAAPSWLARLGTYPRWQLDALELEGPPAFFHHVEHYDLARDAAAALPVHPTQLYELVANLLLFAALLALRGRVRPAGQLSLLFALGYGVLRFALDGLRDDPSGGSLLGFTTAQWLSLGLVPASALVYSLRRARS